MHFLTNADGYPFVFAGWLVSTCATFGVGSADPTPVICTLKNLDRTPKTHHHFTESPLSFLTGLDTKRRERVQGRDYSFTDVTTI